MSDLRNAYHPYLRTGWVGPPPLTAPRFLPDVNPADEVVARMRRRYPGGGMHGTGRGRDGMGEDGKEGPIGKTGAAGAGGVSASLVQQMQSQIAELQLAVTDLEDRLAAASGEAVCNGDGTIDITITI